MKIKNKGQVHPSPSSSPSDHADILQLLPAAILALASVLSIEDREVLAYMITRSMDSSIFLESSKKKPSSRKHFPHTPPFFHCNCFDCYTSYWFRWDSSPNRELIHQVIDAFEDHLTSGENAKRNGHRSRKKERTACPLVNAKLPSTMAVHEGPTPAMDGSSGVAESQDNEASPSISPGRTDNAEVGEQQEMEKKVDKAAVAAAVEEEEEEEASLAFPSSPAINNHRGLARMVLPDVLGLLNSRLWSLWGPNV